MNRQQQKAVKRLDEKIAKAKASNNIIKVMQLTAEREKLFEAEKTEQRTTLKEALIRAGFSEQDRREATVEIIYAVATADLLYGATMEVEGNLRKKFGIQSVPVLDEMRAIVKRLWAIVKSIDDVGSELFSSNYADIVTDIETKYEATLKNYIHNEIIKSSKVINGK